jgi:hypothetical protein
VEDCHNISLALIGMYALTKQITRERKRKRSRRL